MGRIRTVKPELFKHEGLFEAEQASGLPLRLAFIGLFCVADREGRFKWRPRALKLDVLPYDTADFEAVLAALDAAGFIQRYEVDGEPFGRFPNWARHQSINNREQASDLPAPAVAPLDASVTGAGRDACSTRADHDADPTGTPLVHAPVEGKGKEGKNASRTAGRGARRPLLTPMPVDFALSDRVKTWAGQKGYRDLDRHLECFKSRAVAKAYTYADWDEALMGAIRDDWAKLRSGKPPGAGSGDVFEGAH